MLDTNNILLVVPPFTQLNTCYPSVPYLTRFLRTRGYTVDQIDLSIETIDALYSREFLTKVYEQIKESKKINSEFYYFYQHRNSYLNRVEGVKHFLQNRDMTLAHRIVSRDFLPEGPAFNKLQDISSQESFFDSTDRARLYGTLFFEDIAAALTYFADPDFSLIKYSEKVALSSASFNPIESKLEKKPGIIEQIYIDLLLNEVKKKTPSIVGFTIPFPGNLFSTLRLCKELKNNFPSLVTFAGGGFVNTELAEIKEDRFFRYIDYLLFNQGEFALTELMELLQKGKESRSYKNIYYISGNKIVKGPIERSPLKTEETLFPTYEGLKQELYLSMFDSQNAMMRLWNDGRWNKLTLAHGCYWAGCSFCDTSLDYICNFQPLSVENVMKRINTLILETGNRGFHFVDEAAPPALLKKVAIELLDSGTDISYWTNIRFDRNFTRDMAKLLAHSGCIAISGGIEVASPRILKLVNKGVSLEEIITSAYNLSASGVLVHGYLMYGFPGQTIQETIDSLEIVRQMFKLGCIDSAYWHQFTLTTHSPVYNNQVNFGVDVGEIEHSFAYNDIPHTDDTGVDHKRFAEGLNSALAHYMNQQNLDTPVHQWFDFSVPRTSVSPDYVMNILSLNAKNSGKKVLLLRPYSVLRKGKRYIIETVFRGEFYSIRCSENEFKLCDALLKHSEQYKPFPLLEFTALLTKFTLDADTFHSSEVWSFLNEFNFVII